MKRAGKKFVWRKWLKAVLFAVVLLGAISIISVGHVYAADEPNPLVWDKEWGAADKDEAIHDIAPDKFGNLYAIVDWCNRGVGTHEGAYLVKYNKNGIELWKADLGNFYHYTYTLAVDKDGNAYVYGNDFESVYLKKYDPSGSMLWDREIESGKGVNYVTTDPKGNVYITGGFNLGTYENPDWEVFVSKYASDKTWKWTHYINTDGYDAPMAIAASSDYVYVAGKTNGSLPGYTFSGNGFDGFLGKLSQDTGSEVWVRQYGGIYFTDLTTDSLGYPYTIETELLNGYPAGVNACRIKPSNGAVSLIIPLEYCPDFSASHHSGIAVDSRRNIYVSGAVYPDSDAWVPDLIIQKYDDMGKFQTQKKIPYGVGPLTVRIGQFEDIFTAYFADNTSNGNLQCHVVRYQGDLDSDGDGLLDRWETNGVYVNNVFVDLPRMGADPQHKDVFVQIDSMEFCEPKQASLDKVLVAFKNAPVDNPDGHQGINLHIDAGPDSIMNPVTAETWGSFSKSAQVAFDLDTHVWSDVDTAKRANVDFYNSRRPIFHYCLFVNALAAPFDGHSGFSRDTVYGGGSDFIISLGFINDGAGPDVITEAGTFMHELGHNLGLRHGGQDETGFKPNYLSVMNYFWQCDGLTIDDGTGKFVGGNLDYSRFNDILDLDETQLNEQNGVSSLSLNPNLEKYCINYHPGGTPLDTVKKTENGPHNIDWNGNGTVDTNLVSACIKAEMPLSTSLKSYEDWGNLIYMGGSIGALGNLEFDEDPSFVEEMTEDEMKNIPYSYKVLVTPPDNAGATPGGSSVTHIFTITNKGENADTYNLSATSSAGWATLPVSPATVSLNAGQSTTISITVSVPGGTSTAKDKLTLQAVSQTAPNIMDTGTVVTVNQPASLGTEQPITAYPAATNNSIFGTSVDGDWVVWAERTLPTSGNITYYVENIATHVKHTIAVNNYPSQTASGALCDIDNGKVVYEATGGVIGVYNISTGLSTTIVPGGTNKYYSPRIYGNKVIYCSNYGSIDSFSIYVYNLDTGVEREVLPTGSTILEGEDYYTAYRSGDVYGGDIYSDKIVAVQIADPTWNNYTNVVVYDLATDTLTQVTAVRVTGSVRNVQIYGDRVFWEGGSGASRRIYMYDLTTHTQNMINTSITGLFVKLDAVYGNKIIVTEATYNAALSRYNNNLFMIDLTTGIETPVVSATSNQYDAYNNNPAYNGRNIVYTRRDTSNFNTNNLYVLSMVSAPVTALTTTPAAPDGADGWFLAAPQITLTPDKDGVSTFYQWDGNSNPGWSGYNGTFTALEGEHILYYYSADDLGNTESVKSQSFKVGESVPTDTTAPVTALTTSPDLNQMVVKTFKTIPQITLDTGETGITTYYQWDSKDGAWSTYSGEISGLEGEHILYFYSVDASTNTEEVKRQLLNVDTASDTTPPVTALTAYPVAGGPNNLYYSAPAITLRADEPVVTYYCWDEPLERVVPSSPALPDVRWYNATGLSTSPTVYLSQIKAPDGRHTLYYFSVDAAGNIESEVKSQEFFVVMDVTPGQLASGVIGRSYTADLTAEGGTAPYTWTMGDLPAGLSFAAGGDTVSCSVYGTPTETGSSYVSLVLVDNNGIGLQKDYRLTITSASGLAVNNTSLPDGMVGTSYSATLTATGGTEPYTWSAAGLPAGLNINASTGVISGTPTTEGSITVNVSVSDSGSNTDNKSLTLLVRSASVLAINNTTLPEGSVGTSYSVTLTATGGTAPYTWSAAGLPAGLNINASTGVISGTPTAEGSVTVNVSVSDSGSNTENKSLTLLVRPASTTVPGGGGGGTTAAALTITTTELPSGRTGESYTALLSASGGALPYIWKATGLPTGLAITDKGTISGTPSEQGTKKITVTVTDKNNNRTTKDFSMLINETPTVPAAPTGPTDIKGFWAENSINQLINAGIATGYPDNTFRPDNLITRAEFTTMLVNALKLSPHDGKAFPDTVNHWARNSISTASYNQVVFGYGDDRFGPNDLITREQIAAIICRALKLAPGSEGLLFKDETKVSNWAKIDVTAAANSGIITGYTDNTFRPKRYATRAEAAAIIASAMKQIK